ncbi:12535_t:CDS:1, partial [Funneliformis caledonium]
IQQEIQMKLFILVKKSDQVKSNFKAKQVQFFQKLKFLVGSLDLGELLILP